MNESLAHCGGRITSATVIDIPSYSFILKKPFYPAPDGLYAGIVSWLSDYYILEWLVVCKRYK